MGLICIDSFNNDGTPICGAEDNDSKECETSSFDSEYCVCGLLEAEPAMPELCSERSQTWDAVGDICASSGTSCDFVLYNGDCRGYCASLGLVCESSTIRGGDFFSFGDDPDDCDGGDVETGPKEVACGYHNLGDVTSSRCNCTDAPSPPFDCSAVQNNERFCTIRNDGCAIRGGPQETCAVACADVGMNCREGHKTYEGEPIVSNGGDCTPDVRQNDNYNIGCDGTRQSNKYCVCD